jgi:fatty-acyl-CoA synthase
MDLNYATVAENMADQLGDRPCLVCGDTITHWRQFEDRSARIARVLDEHGLGKDCKVGLFMYNCSEYMEGLLAAFKQRAVPININYRYLGDELVYLLADCDAQALIFHSSLGDRVAQIKQKLPQLKLLISVDDGGDLIDGALAYETLIDTRLPAARIERSHTDTMMMYTGGTTGMPKGVEFANGDIMANIVRTIPPFLKLKAAHSMQELVAQAVERAQLGESLVSLPASPLMHTAGIINSGILVQLFGGAMVILQSRSFDPRELWRAVADYGVNHMVVVGDTFVKPMLKVIEEDQGKGISYDISSLKMMISSGVMFSQQSKQALLKLGEMLILDGAGATEGAMAIQLSSRSNPPTATASFTALPSTEIFDENDQLIKRGSGEVGYIGIGGTLPRGYFKDPAKTAKTFRVIEGKRFGFTGDMGSIAADGTLTLVGRGSHCINTGGEKVFPEEVEEAIKLHPKVVDCLVVGLPDDRFGERVAAVVSVSEPLDSPVEQLKEFAGTRLASFKLPRTVEVVAEVQRAPNGKADYKWAKAVFSTRL